MCVTMWTNDVVLRLIDLFRSNKCLWDTANNDYKNKNKKRASWEDIAEKMGMSREIVQTKIHNLRSQFTRERKKVDASKKAGCAEDVKPCFWFAYEPLMFLVKGETSTRTRDTVTEITDTQDSQSSNKSEFETNDEMDTLQESTQDYQAIVILGKSSRKRASKDTLNKPYKTMMEAKNKKDDRVLQDEFDIYAEYVASELRNIKSEEEVLMAKSFINDVLLKARLRSIRKSATNSKISPRGDDDDHTEFLSPDLTEQEENSSVLVKIESSS